MLISSLISEILVDGLDLLSRQLEFYSWPSKKALSRQEEDKLLQIIKNNNYQELSFKVKSLTRDSDNSKQQITKLLLDYCLHVGRRSTIFKLINDDLIDINVRLDNYGRTILHRATCNLDFEFVKILIEKNVNLKLRDFNGNTALHIAIQSYRNGGLFFDSNSYKPNFDEFYKIVSLLLEADSKNPQRYNEERLASEVEFIVNERKNSTRSANIELYNNINREINAQSNRKLTIDESTSPRPLKRSCYGRIKNKHDIGILDSMQMQELTANKQRQITTQGIDCNQDLIQCSQSNNDHKHLQSKKNSLMSEDRFSLLVNTRNAFGQTPFHVCVSIIGEKHISQLVKLLFDYNANPDIIDRRLRTPLYCLLMRSIREPQTLSEVIQMFIDKDCDSLGLTTATLKYHLPPLSYASAASTSTSSSSNITSQSAFFKLSNKLGYVASLKHLTRVAVVKNIVKGQKDAQSPFIQLPNYVPIVLSRYINRRTIH